MTDEKDKDPKDETAPSEAPTAETKFPEPRFKYRTAREIRDETPPEPPWILKPWVEEGGITEIIGLPKAAGKTTLVMNMVRAAVHGGDFLGKISRKTPVVYLTEENSASLREALKRAELLHATDLHCLRWHDTIGRSASWESTVWDAICKCHHVGSRLLIIDTIGRFAHMRHDSENDAGANLELIKPVKKATAYNIAVVIIRHQRKMGGGVAVAGRGSSALEGEVDIIVQIQRPSGNTEATLRELRTLSRFDETPERLIINRIGNGYEVRDGLATISEDAESKILAVAPGSQPGAMTGPELHAAADVKKTTGNEAIERLVKSGQLSVSGTGKRNDARRYWVSSGEDVVSAGSPSPTPAATTNTDDLAIQVGHLGPNGYEPVTPPCFAGRAPHSSNPRFDTTEDGDGTGFDEFSGLCLMCPAAERCQDACMGPLKP